MDSQGLIAATISQFPERFGLRGFPGDVFRCSAIHSYVDDRGLVVIYLECLCLERRPDAWLAHSKGSPAEVRREMVAVP